MNAIGITGHRVLAELDRIEARERRLSLAWIQAGNRRPGALEPTSLGTGQGTLSYERSPEAMEGVAR